MPPTLRIIDRLTPTEQRIYDAISLHNRHTCREISVFTGLTKRSVDTHTQHICAKLGVRNKAELIRRLLKEQDGRKQAIIAIHRSEEN